MSGALVPGRVRSRSAKGQEAGWVGNPAGRSLGDVTCTYYGIQPSRAVGSRWPRRRSTSAAWRR